VPVVRPDPAEVQRARLHQAAQALETLVLKQLITSSKAFTGGEGPGSAVRADMFAETLADAMVKGGGIGLARQIERSLGAPSGAPPPRPPTLPASALPIPSPPQGARSSERGAGSVGDAFVTSAFGARQDPFDGRLTRHEGVDLAGAEGAEVRAARGGVVLRAGERGNYGQSVEIDHGGGVVTLYAHGSELLVREGQTVTPGQPILRVGHSGRATGPHLHFEVRVGGRPVDPGRALKIYGLRAERMIDSES
jgi:murein DD-endopeptidase MepM/ murein hydrolase activator NlpD